MFASTQCALATLWRELASFLAIARRNKDVRGCYTEVRAQSWLMG